MSNDKILWFKKNKTTQYDKKTEWPRISIITPSFNQGEFIEETILSVINQNYPNLEYIIIDGGSTDKTVEIIKKYEKHLAYWISEKDEGQTDAINKGFLKVTGEIFNWLNSDDLLNENALFTIANNFISNKNTLCISGSELRFMNNSIINQSSGNTIEKTLEETLIKAHIDQPSCYFRTSAIKELFPLETSLNYCMDSQLWLNYLTQHGTSNVQKINDILVLFRYHSNSKTYKNTLHFKKELNAILEDLGRAIQSDKTKYFKKIIVKINVEFYLRLLNKKIFDEKSIPDVYINTASYFNSLKLYKPALQLTLRAILCKPLKFLYYKYFFSILKNKFVSKNY